ncbi:sucrase ferredoxin [Actinophytocola gossypii]|uniref:Sucrase ferredoxin n=1 Tax=Actinophytocola gossypii TaxID=2812003 RepID=A0ABT2J2H3_9PSEU|nr:sucrase ferredoxin [Actinophytocola gossypii]MCT2581695.1 sucrase ferredoxin [Actinophytocola gossypii]
MDGLRCSAVAETIGEPLAGTAAVARSWLCVEQPGPWGRDALSASHLDEGVARELTRLSAGTGVRVVLIRRPGSHPDRHRPVPRQVYLAHTTPGGTWLERATVNDPKELLDLDFAQAGAGVPGLLGAAVPDRLLLVCTNGRRDVCCALLGRPIAAALAASRGDAVWECTHIGGHRFSPTAVLLPTGYAYGRLDVAAAERLLDGGSAVVVDGCRGRSTWPGPGQVAELAVRAASGLAGPDVLSVDTVDPVAEGWRVVVRAVSGRAWSVTVVEREVAAPRKASCTAAVTPAVGLVAMSVRETVFSG